jgi:hypothetical protein
VSLASQKTPYLDSGIRSRREKFNRDGGFVASLLLEKVNDLGVSLYVAHGFSIKEGLQNVRGLSFRENDQRFKMTMSCVFGSRCRIRDDRGDSVWRSLPDAEGLPACPAVDQFTYRVMKVCIWHVLTRSLRTRRDVLLPGA